jgi:putative ubiquitin-RnfH superfamily antitoxin RatB of RatAB toxin-antitoxin module
MAESDFIDIEVAYAEPDRQVIVALHVPAGISACEAVQRSGLLERFPGIDSRKLIIGVFGNPVSPRAPLGDGDRVEIYRPLQVDPKEARRLRAARSRVRKKS